MVINNARKKVRTNKCKLYKVTIINVTWPYWLSLLPSHILLMYKEKINMKKKNQNYFQCKLMYFFPSQLIGKFPTICVFNLTFLTKERNSLCLYFWRRSVTVLVHPPPHISIAVSLYLILILHIIITQVKGR